MKKKIILLLMSIILLTGCSLTKDDFSDDYTYVTNFPIEYLTKQIFGSYSNIISIYPDGTNPDEYKLTKKLLNNYSKGNKFAYNGLTDERLIARDLLNLNGKINIIDAMKGMNYDKSIEELWLNPANYLMIARNIKESLMEYETNNSIKLSIEEKYLHVKEEISIIDVDIYELSKNGTYKSLLVSNDIFNFLKKYDIDVISLDSSNDSLDKNYNDAKKLINDKSVKYIYTLRGESISDTLNTFISDYKLEKIEIDPFITITDEQRSNGETYSSLMNKIIDEFKKELFK